MSLEELLDRLLIAGRPQRSVNGSYVIDLNNSIECGKMFSRLDRLKESGDLIELDGSHLSEENLNVDYRSIDGNLFISLSGYYATDEYTISITES